MTSLYEILKTSKLGAGAAPDMFTALLATKKSGTVKTLTDTPPLTFKSNGTPLISWQIDGNTTQIGTPTPSSPVAVNGVGEKTANLFDKSKFTFGTGATIVYVPIYVGEGTFTLSTDFPDYDVKDVFLLPGNVSSGASSSNNGVSATTKRTRTAVDGYITVATRYNPDRENPADYNYMLNTDAQPLPYEPYGYKISVSCGSTTPVYLGTAQSTRKVKKLVLTGEEDITSTHLDVGLFNIPVTGYLRLLNQVTCICSHYIGAANVGGWSAVGDKTACFYAYTGTSEILYIRDSTYNTINAFKAFLAEQYANGTPVTVWYVLAEAETGIVNEPLQKIGDYADTISSENTGAPTIPTARGSNTLTVSTTVQPSSMTITYKEG